MKSSKNKSWKRVCYISEFPDWSATLQFEWRWKQLSRKYQSSMNPLERRIRALHDLLSLTQSTSKAVPFSKWLHKPIVHVETDIEIFSLYLDPSSTDDSYNIVDVLDRNSENIVVSDATLTSINGSLIELDKNVTGVAANRRLSVRRQYTYASSSNTPISASSIIANIQNTYSENDEYMYVASNSLPGYEIDEKLSTAKITLTPSSNLNSFCAVI